MKAKALWAGGYQSIVDDRRGHSVVNDLPADFNGENNGATSLEMCTMSLAGCISTIFRMMADKMKLSIDHFEVDVEAEKIDGTIGKAVVAAKVKSSESKEKLEKAYKLTCDTCPVGVLFVKAGVEVTKTLEIL
ncbi:MAG: OsmC family protein [Hyphomicrobiales bacterium]